MAEDYKVKIKYHSPREALGRYLATLGLPEDRWDTHFNKEQKEFWYTRADQVLKFIKDKGL